MTPRHRMAFATVVAATFLVLPVGAQEGGTASTAAPGAPPTAEPAPVPPPSPVSPPDQGQATAPGTGADADGSSATLAPEAGVDSAPPTPPPAVTVVPPVQDSGFSPAPPPSEPPPAAPGKESTRPRRHSLRGSQRFEVGYMGGWGLKRLTLAEVEVTESIGGMTTSVSNQAIKAAVGGGNGFSLGYAWAPVRYFEFGVLLSAQFSPLAKKDVGEAKGSFFKAIDTAGAALRVPLGTSSRGQFQNGKPIWTDTTWLIGGGGGVSRADATINLTAIENGTSSKAEYGFSPVWYVGTGIEFAERAGRGRGLGFGMRLTYHDVTYDLEKVTEADQEVPLELVRPELRRVKGNAINLNLIVAGLL